jgi:hypothetical protein
MSEAKREVAYKFVPGHGFVVDAPARDIYADEPEYCDVAEQNIANSGVNACWKKVEKVHKVAKADEGGRG